MVPPIDRSWRSILTARVRGQTSCQGLLSSEVVGWYGDREIIPSGGRNHVFWRFPSTGRAWCLVRVRATVEGKAEA